MEGPPRRLLLRWAIAGALFALSAAGAGLDAQEPQRRPIPAGVTPPPEYQRALDRGWRSEDGRPGHSYWQNRARYDIEATLDPETGRLEGSVRILYAHQAPANLNSVWLHLYQNLHKEGAPRLEAQEITGGVTLTRVVADGEELSEGSADEEPSWEVDGTLLQVRPSIRLEPGDTLELELDWEVTLPQSGAGRMGHSEREMYFVAYWFPKMVLLDDLRLWNADDYLGPAEFYDGFGDYRVSLTVPVNWTVMATGTLENPEEVYSAITIDRLAQAATTDERVVVAGQAERDAETVTTQPAGGALTYRFRADNVRDFAWTTSSVQRWDASSVAVADRDEDGVEDRVLVHAFWRESRAPLWDRQWEYARQSIEHHSRYTELPYPWAHMTSVEGADIIDGGMEFPMMTIIGPYRGRDTQDLFNVTSHEIGHMWIPMIVGTNEKRHAWMDEGTTTYLENQSRMEVWPGIDHHRVEARSYFQVATAASEQSMMQHGDYYVPGPGYGIASYVKPAALLVALRELVLGREAFEEAYRTFISEWAYKHPQPWDFFATFERVHGSDLDWFWTSFFYETWTMDHAVRGTRSSTGGATTVTIEDRGLAPFPAVVRVRTARGETIRHEIPVDHWLAGNSTYDLEVPASAGAVTRVDLDPSGYTPDVDRTNNFWPRGR